MAKVYQQVLDGAYESHILPFLWQKGESQEVIAEYLEQIAGAGIREVCLESRPHPDFMGEGWWHDLAFIIERCKDLGLKIWLLDDSHFPTGYANGALEKLPADSPLRKTVLTHRVVDVVGPTPRMAVALTNMFDETERFYGVVALRDGAVIELPIDVEHGPSGTPARLLLDAPEGVTQLCLMFTSKKTGFRDEYINMVDKASCDLLIQAVYQPHYDHFADEFGKTILGFFTDEPGFMNQKGGIDTAYNADTLIGKEDMPLPWSDELEHRLRAALGDTYLQQLPLLWTRGDAGSHARHTYMDVATQLYRECFDENLGSWCRKHGVMHIGHVIEDKDCHARLGVGAGHYFRAVAGQDMAGVDIVINQLVPGIDTGFHSYGRGKWDMEFFNYALPKLGSSAAHIDPLKQGRCMAEVFGAFGWHEGLKEMKWICDHFLARGVNWFVPHAFSQAPFPDWDCPPHFYAHGNNPQFRHFNLLMGYLNRMGTLLSGGTAHTPVAVLYHADAEWRGNAMPVQKIARELTRNQIDFDFVPEDAFCDARRYTVEVSGDGAGFTVNGQAYQCLVVPAMDVIGTDTLAFARDAADAGLPVFWVAATPRTADGTDGCRLVDVEELKGTRPVALSELAPALIAAGLRENEVADYQPWLRAYRYTKQGEEYLFLVNEHPKQAISTSLPGVHGIAIDLLYGEAPHAFDEALELAPYESKLVVLGESYDNGGEPDKRNPERMALQGNWTVAYASSLEYPAFEEAQRISQFEDLSSTLFPGKCGTFRYERTFELAEDVDGATLDIEDAYETVEVFVDGAPSGVRVAPPYRLPLGALAAGEHALAIEVTNTLDKQVTDMFSLTEPSEPTGIIGTVALEISK